VGYSVINVDDIEPGGPTGAVRFVRRELGVEAFGINWFELQPGVEGHEHDEQGSGQEEVCVVVRGSGLWRADGEECRCASAPSCASTPRRPGVPSPARTA
jgi:hypothetical protein